MARGGKKLNMALEYTCRSADQLVAYFRICILEEWMKNEKMILFDYKQITEYNYTLFNHAKIFFPLY